MRPQQVARHQQDCERGRHECQCQRDIKWPPDGARFRRCLDRLTTLVQDAFFNLRTAVCGQQRGHLRHIKCRVGLFDDQCEAIVGHARLNRAGRPAGSQPRDDQECDDRPDGAAQHHRLEDHRDKRGPRVERLATDVEWPADGRCPPLEPQHAQGAGCAAHGTGPRQPRRPPCQIVVQAVHHIRAVHIADRAPLPADGTDC